MHKFITIGLLFISLTGFGQARRALSLMDKLKYEAAFELLQNGLIKDSTSASTPFVLANMYLVNEWPQSSLDSAYYFSLLSLSNYDLLSEKQLDKHIKDDFGKTRLVTLKKVIDSLAFLVAKSNGAEQDYQVFIERHSVAKELDSAIFLRNEQAYLLATNANSLNSYKAFLNKYPKADDWQRADDRYQKILYNEITSSGKLQEYISFVNTYPHSPYYDKAIDHIYTIEVGQNSIESIIKFVNTYPNNRNAKKATGLLYHLHLSQEPASTFADKYPTITIGDSLKLIIDNQDKTLVPIWNQGIFQLVDLNQNVLIDSILTLEEKTINLDYISIKKGDFHLLAGINGYEFYSGTWQHVDKEMKGFVFLKNDEGSIVIHKNGSVIGGGDNANLVGPFIGYKINDLWGLKSTTNIEIIKPSYDSIWFEHGLIFLSTKNKVSPNKPKTFYPSLDGESNNIEPFYEEYEWLTDSLLWISIGEKEGLYSHTLTEIIPVAKQQIDLARSGWSNKQKSNITIPDFSESTLTDFDENNTWQIGKLKDSLVVKYKYDRTFHPLDASLLGPSAILMHWHDSSFVYLLDTIRFYKAQKHKVKPLLNQSNHAFYYEVSEEKNKWIINCKGKQLDLPTYNKMIPLNHDFFQLNTKKNNSLYSSSGELLLDDIDGSSLVNDSIISILKDQHFGIFQPNDSILIEANYSKRLVPIADSLWVISVGNKLGLINSKEQELLTTQFDEITYWTNGLLFMKQDLKWNIYDLKSSKFTEFGITSFKSITQWDIPIINYQKGVGTGIYDSQKGVVLKPTYTAIALEGTASQPYYRAEKHVEEAGLHILLFYNLDGDLLFQNIMDEKAFGKLYGYPEE